MTTDQPPFDDLQLSAALDGDVDAEVASRIDQDPDARARLDRLRSARDLVARAEVVPLPDAAIDRLVATALDTGLDTALDTALETTDPDPAAPSLLAPSPGRRPGPVPAWLVAAVVLVLMGVGLSLVYSGRDDADVAFDTVGQSISGAVDDGSAASDGGETAALDTADSAAGAATESSGTDEAPATTSAAGTTDRVLVALGSFPDPDALREHLRDGFPEVGDATEPATEPATETDLDAAFRCLGKIDGMFNTGSEPVHVGIATVADEPTVVYELPYRTDDGRDTTLVVAVGELTCIPSLSFQR